MSYTRRTTRVAVRFGAPCRRMSGDGLRRLLLLGAALVTPPAVAQNQLWIRQFGSSPAGGPAWDMAEALASDGAGGVFIGGYTWGSLFGPYLGSPFSGDAFVTRYDAAGNQLWGRQFGTAAIDRTYALAPDGSGGVYAAGETSGSLGGPFAGVADPWLARYDSAGTRLWVRQFGTNVDEHATAAAPDGSGGVFVGGFTFGSLGGPSAGANDAWLARYDSAGTRLWIRQFGTSGDERISAATLDGSGGVFVGGWTSGSMGGPSAGGADAWVGRFDSAGNQVWIRQLGSTSFDQVLAAAPDGAGGVFVGGYTEGSLAGTSAGSRDAWLARYDSAGNQAWIRQFGTSGDDRCHALAFDGMGGAFSGGFTTGSLAGPSAGMEDAWLARHDSAGNQTWSHQFGTSDPDRVQALAPDASGGVFASGPTFASLGGPSAGAYDVWLARYGSLCYPDCNGDGALNLADFGCFQTKFALLDPYADCNGDGALNLADFGCFQTKFALGCP